MEQKEFLEYLQNIEKQKKVKIQLDVAEVNLDFLDNLLETPDKETETAMLKVRDVINGRRIALEKDYLTLGLAINDFETKLYNEEKD